MALQKWKDRFTDRFSSAWTLLSDTDSFLSRARLKPRFEGRLREWRQRLQESRGRSEVHSEVRSEIVAVRKALREQGWELRLGSVDVEVKGFRSDDSVARGFRRMVIYFGESGAIYHVVGDSNHIDLDNEIRRSLQSMGVADRLRPHYLWYRVSAGLIELAGSDSESEDALEQLREIVEERKSDLVKAFKKLH